MAATKRLSTKREFVTANLSERNGTLSEAFMRRKSEINACTTAEGVRAVVSDILQNDASLKPSAKTYGNKLMIKLNKSRDAASALQIVYNVILAGDNCGCFWTSAASSRMRA